MGYKKSKAQKAKEKKLQAQKVKAKAMEKKEKIKEVKRMRAEKPKSKLCGKCGLPKGYCRCGRPSSFTEEIVQKLLHAFAVDATDEEACFYAEVSTTAFYNYQKKHPEFKKRKEELKNSPILAAKSVLVKSAKSSPKYALEYLKRKRKHEFSEKVISENYNQSVVQVTAEDIEKINAAIDRDLGKLNHKKK